jgi:hypothetical protein
METPKLIIPTVHLNGTSKDELLEQIEEAYAAIGTAVKALAKMGPNGRDYYVQKDNPIYQAQDQHSARMKKLLDVQRELEALVEGIADQPDNRNRRTA